MSDIVAKLNLKYEVSIFVATGGGTFRKPLTGVIDSFFNCDKLESVMVGDAAGRYNEDTGFYIDHSCCDRAFAVNAGIKFFTLRKIKYGKIVSLTALMITSINILFILIMQTVKILRMLLRALIIIR